MSHSCWRTSSRLTTSAFPNRGDGKLFPPHLKGNMDSPIKFINCAMFPENEAGKCFSTFHHQQIPRRNSICIMTAWSFLRSEIVYLFSQENTSRKFLNLLLFYLPVFDCNYRLRLPLFSLNVVAFACTCEPVGTQHSFEFLCLVSGSGV